MTGNRALTCANGYMRHPTYGPPSCELSDAPFLIHPYSNIFTVMHTLNATRYGNHQTVPIMCFDRIIRHDDVIKWKYCPRYWPFVRGIHRSPVTRSCDVFFYFRLNKRLSKQSWGWWFETPSRSLWRHRNGCRRVTSAIIFGYRFGCQPSSGMLCYSEIY